MTTLDSYDVRRIVQEARDGGLVPDLSGADLSRELLSGAKLRRANLRRAKLHDADLSGADLSGAKLSYANLRGAKLSYANLRRANLYGADLSGANLYGADLSGANLYGADLSDTNLHGANLQRVIGWDGLQITNLHPYPIHLTATTEGWSIRIGCWTGTPDELEALISQDEGWPESTGEQITKNRALLTAALVMIRAYIDARPMAINDEVKSHAMWADENQEKK